MKFISKGPIHYTVSIGSGDGSQSILIKSDITIWRHQVTKGELLCPCKIMATQQTIISYAFLKKKSSNF